MLDEQRRTSVELVAVSIDSLNMLQKMEDQISRDGTPSRITFLSDPDHRVIDRYGLLNPNNRGWPHPTTYVIDRGGVVRWKFTEINYKVRPTNAMILEALGKVEAARK